MFEENPYAEVLSKFSGEGIYEWNIYGKSEYQILDILNLMVITSNSFKKYGSSNKKIAKISVAGFTSMLKG